MPLPNHQHKCQKELTLICNTKNTNQVKDINQTLQACLGTKSTPSFHGSAAFGILSKGSQSHLSTLVHTCVHPREQLVCQVLVSHPKTGTAMTAAMEYGELLRVTHLECGAALQVTRGEPPRTCLIRQTKHGRLCLPCHSAYKYARGTQKVDSKGKQRQRGFYQDCPVGWTKATTSKTDEHTKPQPKQHPGPLNMGGFMWVFERLLDFDTCPVKLLPNK